MTRLLLLAVLFASCAPDVYEDKTRGVVCYVARGARSVAVSCLQMGGAGGSQ